MAEFAADRPQSPLALARYRHHVFPTRLETEETISMLPDTQMSAAAVHAAMRSLRQHGWCVLRGLVRNAAALENARGTVLELYEARHAPPTAGSPAMAAHQRQQPGANVVEVKGGARGLKPG